MFLLYKFNPTWNIDENLRFLGYLGSVLLTWLNIDASMDK